MYETDSSKYSLFIYLTYLFLYSLGAPIYSKTGGTVVLSPGNVTEPITKITWKHKGDMAMEWDRGNTEAYRQFKGTFIDHTFTVTGWFCV